MKCSLEECDRPRYGKHPWCRKHHQRWVVTGDPRLTKTPLIPLGTIFNRWMVIEQPPERSSRGRMYTCLCECGSVRVIAPDTLKNGKSQSCGCLQKEGARARAKHGLIDHPQYCIWRAMRGRCNNPKNRAYKYYGGKGVRVCKRWDNFAHFLADMGVPPAVGWHLHRIDNDGPYSPENCKWLSPSAHRKVHTELRRAAKLLAAAS